MNSIALRQDELTSLYESVASKKKPAREHTSAQVNTISYDDRILLDIASHARNGAKFSALWRGSTAGYASPSEADLAFCSLLAFYTGDDAGRIDRLFRQSGLYRSEKWDRPAREGETYGEGTIRIAIDSQFATYGQGTGSVQEPVEHADTESVTSFTHALNLTDECIETISHEELKQAAHEQHALIDGMLSIIYARQAKAPTRIAAIDLLVMSAKRTAKGLQSSIHEPAPVCISNEYGVAARLGIHRNTISAAYHTLHTADLIERQYRTDEETEIEHLDIALQPEFLSNIEHLSDKKARKQPEPQTFKPAADSTHCAECGSGDINIVCRSCGNVDELGELPAKTDSACTNFVQSSNTGDCVVPVVAECVSSPSACTKFVQADDTIPIWCEPESPVWVRMVERYGLDETIHRARAWYRDMNRRIPQGILRTQVST